MKFRKCLNQSLNWNETFSTIFFVFLLYLQKMCPFLGGKCPWKQLDGFSSLCSILVSVTTMCSVQFEIVFFSICGGFPFHKDTLIEPLKHFFFNRRGALRTFSNIYDVKCLQKF